MRTTYGGVTPILSGIRRFVSLANHWPVKSNALVLTSPRSGDILGLLDILVDIGVSAEKEVIQ